MPQPDDDSREALKRLDDRLKAFRPDETPLAGAASAERGVGDAYRLLGEVLGGILGGIGLGWVVDHFAHTTPFGMVIGLLLGTAAAAYAAMHSAGAGRGAAKSDGTED
ncbi:MAG TPA: AtpZ/AtpI family protein [Caulobacteraceae bacterium]|nr:AtpZ/AtpI family protein [Caulobacteraceae bacterium]